VAAVLVCEIAVGPPSLGRSHGAKRLAKLFTEFIEEFLIEQFLPKGGEDAPFDLVTPDSQPVGARALFTCTKARQPVNVCHDEPGATHAALRQTREQITIQEEWTTSLQSRLTSQ
jgi:hypothetical protein